MLKRLNDLVCFLFFSGCRDLMSIAELSPDHKFKDPDVSYFSWRVL